MIILILAELIKWIFVYNPVKQQTISIVGGNDRSAGSEFVTVPSTFGDDEVHCYIAFQNANQSVLSNSQYTGTVTVLPIVR